MTSPVLFLCGHRKGGTSMFLHLFDSHPDLLVYPTDINLFYAYYPIFIEGDYSRDERAARLDRIEFGDLIEQNSLGGAIDIEAFRKIFFSRMEGKSLDDVRVVLPEFLDAFQEILGQAGRKAAYSVVKETSLEVYATEFSTAFPGSRFIHLIRDPRDNYAALRAGVERYKTFGDDEKSLLYSMMHRALLGMKLAISNRAALGADLYRAVRFEDVISDPEKTLRGITDWLGIDFAETLLTPSILGKPTSGNNYDNHKFFEISAQNVGRWPERILAEEAKVLEFYFGDVMETFGYQRTFDEAETLQSVGDFYKWVNYKNFYFDRFAT